MPYDERQVVRVLQYAGGIAIVIVLIAVAVKYGPEAMHAYDTTGLRKECESVDAERTGGIIFTNPEVVDLDPALFCTCLSEAARRTSSNWLLFAIPLALVGGVMALLGATLGPKANADRGTFQGERGVLLAGGGALVIAFAVYMNSRATAASTVAATAHSALALSKPEMRIACIQAKSSWISSRADSTSLLLKGLVADQSGADAGGKEPAN